MNLLVAAVDCTTNPSNPACLGQMLKVGPDPANANRQIAVYQQYGSVASFLNFLVPLAFVIAGIILLFLLIGGGFSIVASGGNAKSVEQGKGQITGAVIGFLIIFAAYWIIQIIQTVTGVPILNSTL